MNVRKAHVEDLPQILEIYAGARCFMKENENPDQWGDFWPLECVILKDIRQGICHVVVDDVDKVDSVENFCGCDDVDNLNGKEIFGVFAYLDGPDSTYNKIEGAWLNDQPYGVIHRIASSGKKPGVLKAAVEHLFKDYDNIRIDTHEDNIPMQNALKRLGFTYCGKIYLKNGDPRIAFQLGKPTTA